jgi:hypothetical protein
VALGEWDLTSHRHFRRKIVRQLGVAADYFAQRRLPVRATCQSTRTDYGKAPEGVAPVTSALAGPAVGKGRTCAMSEKGGGPVCAALREERSEAPAVAAVAQRRYEKRGRS